MRKGIAFIRTFIITKRTFTAAIAISILFSLPFFVSLVSNAFISLCKEEAISIYGRFDNVIYDESNDDIFDNITGLTDSSNYINYYGIINVGESEGNTVFGTADQKAVELGNVHIVEGRFPEKSDEICMCEALYYEEYSDYMIGTVVSIGNKDYLLTGLINDYYVAWNKPPKDIVYAIPNVFLNELENRSCQSKIVLIKNKNVFPSELYKNNRNLIANTNVIYGDIGAKYNAPDFVYITLYVSVLILIVYIISFLNEKDKINKGILNRLGVPRTSLQAFVIVKYSLITLFSVFIGYYIGQMLALFFIKNYNRNRITQIPYPDINSIVHLIICVTICILAVVVFFILDNKRIKERKSIKLLKLNQKGLVVSELIEDYKNIAISSVVTAIMLVSILILGLYLKMYISIKGNVFGKMPIDYDYQFTTNQNVDDYSYTDINGEIVSVINLPDDESIYYMPTHSNIIEDSIINKMDSEAEILRVSNYIEANDVYLDLTDVNDNFDYLTGFPVDKTIDDKLGVVLGLNDNSKYRNSQFCGFPEYELFQLEHYVMDGSLNYQKINDAEEIILVVPVYEKVEYGDGTWGIDFIEYDDYTGKGNQYIDKTFHVGDKVDLIQILPKDNRMMGNLNSKQIQNDTYVINYKITIGAIIYERVMWFEDASQMPTAYSFIGTEKTLETIGFNPTFSRTQIYLNEGINYRQFEPIIHKYQDVLEGFDYKNNAAEMEEYRQFMSLLKGLCYLLIVLSIGVMLIITVTETFISFSKRRSHYAMMRIIGMTPSKYIKIISMRILIVFIASVLLYICGGLFIINLIFGTTKDIVTYLGHEFVLSEITFSLIILSNIVLIIYSPVLKKYVVKYCDFT